MSGLSEDVVRMEVSSWSTASFTELNEVVTTLSKIGQAIEDVITLKLTIEVETPLKVTAILFKGEAKDDPLIGIQVECPNYDKVQNVLDRITKNPGTPEPASVRAFILSDRMARICMRFLYLNKERGAKAEMSLTMHANFQMIGYITINGVECGVKTSPIDVLSKTPEPSDPSLKH